MLYLRITISKHKLPVYVTFPKVMVKNRFFLLSNDFKKETYLEIDPFSDFTTNGLTEEFSGEISLSRYFDGEKTIPVTGGSISGNINQLQNEIFLSKELQKDNNFEVPRLIKLLNVTVSGIE